MFLNSLIFFQNNGQSEESNNINRLVSGAFVLTVLILFFGLYYKLTLDRMKSYKRLPKVVFLVFLLIRWIKKTTIEMLGRRYSFVIPFFIYIVFYFWGSSLVGMFGFNGISTFAIVPISIATLVFLGTIFLGVTAKGWGFCRDYCIWLKWKGKKILPIPDVLKVLGEVGKIVSLGLRLWGNYFAGAIVLFMVKHFLEEVLKILGNTGGAVYTGTALFPLHIYFDIVDGALHSMIFLLLTFSYWSMAKDVEHKG